MHDIDHAWTRMLLEAIASLGRRPDKDQAGCPKIVLEGDPAAYPSLALVAIRENGRPSHADWHMKKWTARRCSSSSNGPEHYPRRALAHQLSRGQGAAARPLPIARDYCGLAVFENLRNAYSGSDGGPSAAALRTAICANLR